jgi:predicted Zn-dependent peptidase
MVESIILKNGLKVVINHLPHREVIAMNIFVKVGALYEAPNLKGISHFLENMLFLGSLHYPDPDAAALKKGAVLTGETAEDWTQVGFTSMKKNCLALIPLLLDIVFYPKIEPQDIEQIKFKIISGMPDSLSPWELAEIGLDDLLFGEKRMDVCGDKETIGKLSREEVKQWHKEYYYPKNTVLMISGDIEWQNIRKAVEDFSFPPNPPPKRREKLMINPSTHYHFIKKEITNSEIYIAFISPKEDLDSLGVMSVLFGNYPKSLLWEMAPGICYQTESSIKVYPSLVKFSIHLGVVKNKVGMALEKLSSLISKVKEGDIAPERVMVAKKVYEKELSFVEENLGVSLRWLADRNLYRRKPDSFTTAKNRVKRVSFEGIKKLAQELFIPQNTYICIVGETPPSDFLNKCAF